MANRIGRRAWQRTTWERDVQGRVTREIRADNTTGTVYTYDLAGRLKTVTDPKDQVTTHSYNLDDSLSGTGTTWLRAVVLSRGDSRSPRPLPVLRADRRLDLL